MSYLADAVFPIGISRGATGGPGWASDVVTTRGGYRYTNQDSAQGLCRFDVSHAARIATTFATLLAHFRVCRGPLHSFPFRDWSDFEVTTGQGVFLQLTSTTFQMYRRYTRGAQNHDRKIVKPESSTVIVTGGTGASVDYTTGIVTVSSGTPTAWTGRFYVPCNYEMEGFSGEIIDGTPAALIMGWSGIRLVETRNP